MLSAIQYLGKSRLTVLQLTVDEANKKSTQQRGF